MQADAHLLMCDFSLMPEEDQLEAVRSALRHMMKAAQVEDATQLARKAGIAHTTLTRIMAADSADVTWTLSAKTWMKLSQASGVPVVLLGDRVIVPDAQPSAGDGAVQSRRARLLAWWDDLTPAQQDHFVNSFSSWSRVWTDATAEAKVG